MHGTPATPRSTPHRFEFFEAWPATPDAAGGAIVDVLPWDLACPPGYELPGEEAAKDEL